MKLVFDLNYIDEYDGNKVIRNVKEEFETTENTIIEDLFPFFDNALGIDPEISKSCTRFCYFFIGNKKYSVVSDFNLILFVKLNNLDSKNIRVNIGFGGIGGSDHINDKLVIFIPSSEKNHKERPHIHVSNCKGENAVVFSLIDNAILAGKDNWKKYFTRKEKKNILNCISKYRVRFSEYYNTISKGLIPDPVKYTYGNDENIRYLN